MTSRSERQLWEAERRAERFIARANQESLPAEQGSESAPLNSALITAGSQKRIFATRNLAAGTTVWSLEP